MSFINKKEEVLDIELTQLGKYLLAKGKFKPVYYVFSDDEVLYNTKYADTGILENDKQAQVRIQKDTQRNMNYYEHDGVESRILTLNGHEIEKIRGHDWFARKTGRVEELPVGEIYGIDTVEEEKMGADDRNLIRNFIGNSTLGERKMPSWDVELLAHGTIDQVNISSSSPNVGIKRPILTVEEDNLIVPKQTRTREPLYGITNEQFDMYTGLEKKIGFVDGVTATIEDDMLIFSMAEQNTDYIKKNFDFELYEITGESTVPGTESTIEHLRRLYFSDENEDLSTRHVEYYFDVLLDHDLADEFGFDLRGNNRDKLRENFKDTIQAVIGETLPVMVEDYTVDIGNIEEECDD